MKLVAFISCVLVMFLSIQPMFIKWNAGATEPIFKTTCCKKSADKKCPVKKQEQQQENPCNPFMPCNLCPYVPEEPQELFTPIILVRAENTNRLNSFILSIYNADCWHPPEL